MSERQLKSVGDTLEWRTLSSLDVVGDRMYFSAAYDGEEEGVAVDASDVLRKGGTRKAFRSLIAQLTLPDGEPTIVSRFDGLKVEGVASLGPTAATPGAAELLITSDDEALGCLAGVGSLIDDGNRIEADVSFVNLGQRASAQNKGIKMNRWGVSGVAALAFLPIPTEPSA